MPEQATALRPGNGAYPPPRARGQRGENTLCVSVAWRTDAALPPFALSPLPRRSRRIPSPPRSVTPLRVLPVPLLPCFLLPGGCSPPVRRPRTPPALIFSFSRRRTFHRKDREEPTDTAPPRVVISVTVAKGGAFRRAAAGDGGASSTRFSSVARYRYG